MRRLAEGGHRRRGMSCSTIGTSYSWAMPMYPAPPTSGHAQIIKKNELLIGLLRMAMIT